MLSKLKVNTLTPKKGILSDIPSFSEERACAHSNADATTAQDQPQAASPPILETPRTLTFAELQTLIEQGKTDEIPNNKHIPDIINVVPISYAVLATMCSVHNIHIHDRKLLPVNQTLRSAKSPGSSHCHRNDVRCRVACRLARNVCLFVTSAVLYSVIVL